MKMKIDLEKCVHCGTCFAVYPNLVEQKDWNFVIKEWIEMTEDEKKELIAICPVEAIWE